MFVPFLNFSTRQKIICLFHLFDILLMKYKEQWDNKRGQLLDKLIEITEEAG
jgi:hypothetical protein